MTFTILSLTAAYALVAAFLAYVLLLSPLHWVFRTLATAATVALIPLTFNGIGELRGQAFRIAHMGHVNAPMILGTLGVIEMALNALHIPHGKGGTAAAIDWLGETVSA